MLARPYLRPSFVYTPCPRCLAGPSLDQALSAVAHFVQPSAALLAVGG